MTDLKSSESQQELFHEFSGEPLKPERLPSLQKAPKPILLTTSVEQIILAVILLILALCLIFFLGVLRGKALTVRPTQARVVATPVTRALSGVRTTVATPTALVASTTAAVPAVALGPTIRIQPKPDPNKQYTVQLVSFKRDDLAQAEANAWSKRGYLTSVARSGDYFIVRAGQYASSEEAKRDLAVFKAKYRDAFLRRR